MFTGLVEEVGIVERVQKAPFYQLGIKAHKVLEGTEPSHSIAVNGICLTVTGVNGNVFTVRVMPQTLDKTNLSRIKGGDKVNLERALTPTARLGGHMVTGDIDGVGKITGISRRNGQTTMQIKPPLSLTRYIVNQGRLALEGVSLTVASSQEADFTVCLIPFTLENTTLGLKQRDDLVNLEVDIISKYVEKLVQSSNFPHSKIDREFLKKAGW